MEWRDFLHSAPHGEHVLFASLKLSSWGPFAAAAMLTVAICLTERALTFVLSSKCQARLHRVARTRLAFVLLRTALYWLATLLRLLYMLIGMTFNLGLILTAVSTLAVGQLAIEWLEYEDDGRSRSAAYSHIREVDGDADIPLRGTTAHPK
ncbi:hypothetical protein AURDEDRAFT_109944 [Auricularia subglabra TFB-10046 SS5]|nr:hypothetical protein AURDEDRAFT_109944 [Auricularia subglabra TFB-10046 SS5]